MVESLEARGQPTKRGAKGTGARRMPERGNNQIGQMEEMDEKAQFNGVKASSRIRHPRVTFGRYLGIELSPEGRPIIPSFWE